MAIFLAGKAVCYRILAFFCYGKLHFKCESADLLTPQPYINMSSETYSIPAHLCVCTLNCQCTGASGRLFKIPIWRMVS